MIDDSVFWLIICLVPTTVLMVDLARKLWRSIFVPTVIDHAVEVDRGITHDAAEMMRVYEGDEGTIRGILDARGEQADDGMYKWWMAFNDRLPKFRFDRRKLRALNRGLEPRAREEMGIVDTETDGVQTGFVFDHVSKEIGVGGGDDDVFVTGRQWSDDTASLRESGRGGNNV